MKMPYLTQKTPLETPLQNSITNTLITIPTNIHLSPTNPPPTNPPDTSANTITQNPETSPPIILLPHPPNQKTLKPTPHEKNFTSSLPQVDYKNETPSKSPQITPSTTQEQ
jgi:hypothetical protein